MSGKKEVTHINLVGGSATRKKGKVKAKRRGRGVRQETRARATGRSRR